MGLGVDLSKLRVGDVIEMKRTLQVQRTEKDYVEAVDVQSDHRFGFTGSDQGGRGTLKLSVVAKAKPKVGDIVDAKTIREVRWKRGTLIQVSLLGGATGATYMLTAEGDWVSAGGTPRVNFSDFRGNFKLLHVA
jgi:hypothetical protein